MKWAHLNIYLIWGIIFHLVMLANTSNVTTASPQVAEPGFAWSAWGSWSPCSKTCGGGVAVQQRQCLPRSRTVSNTTLPVPMITVRVTRQVAEECPGIDKRYHQCNTMECPGETRDQRAEQCSMFDRRPFRGRFYTWVPYVDGNSPCTLNCRPLGQQFYASLDLVADGTPCTKPGYRAICVHGHCKVVGRESVLAVAGSRELRCGRRLVSGLFSRPRLPLGYSYVTTVPRGACRLNVSEIHSSENYIALKISNGSYIMNGEFAVSAPGNYEAAGTRFKYTRAGGLDSVYSLGPTHHPIDIMILYTQPNPSIRYEYFTESLPGEVDTATVTRPNIPEAFPTVQAKHNRRHHSFDYARSSGSKYPNIVSKEVSSAEDNLEENVIGERKFIWKIISYTQCTRTCGGGIQVGKYRCVESSLDEDRDVSPAHCVGSPPAGRRRRCGIVPCAPRWRAAAWSGCPECGPATRTRIVGCVQDHSRGITKISDQKCPAPKPSTTENCNIPDCNRPNNDEVNYIEPKTGLRSTSYNTDTFRDGPVYTVDVNSTDLDVGPEYSYSSTAGWLYTEWSECVGWCVGGGVQTREYRCGDPSGCEPRKNPESSRKCTPKIKCETHDGEWYTGEWSQCSSPCGGKQIRGVLCIGGSGRHLRDTSCKRPRPDHERECGEECQPAWFYSDWGQCIGNCTFGTGLQRRTVWCASKDAASSEEDCSGTRPQASQTCVPKCPVTTSTVSSVLTIESQRTPGYETISSTTTERIIANEQPRDCEDKLPNCFLAVQARLCHYNYYVLNCCASCKGR